MQKAKLKTLWDLFVIFWKAGSFTFAGGLAMLPVIEKDIVEKYKMMPRSDFLEYATLAQSLPGVIAINCAYFIGKRTAGMPGMLAAAAGASFSAFVLMLLATILLQIVPMSGPVAGAFNGIRAASSALILAAAFSLGRHNIKNLFSIAVMTVSFVLVLVFNLSSPLVLVAAGLSGFVWYRLLGRKQVS